MQQLLFIIFFLGALYTLYQCFKSNTQFFALMSTGFNLGLFGGLVGSGINFLTQVDSSGNFIYTAATAASDPFVGALAMTFFGFGMLSMYWFFRILARNDWKIQLL